MGKVCQDHYSWSRIACPEWRAIVNIFPAVLPTLGLNGLELESPRCFNIAITHMGRSNRKTTFLRLIKAIKALVLEFPSIMGDASVFLWDFLSCIDGTTVILAPYDAKISMLTIPMSVVKKGGVVTFKNSSN